MSYIKFKHASIVDAEATAESGRTVYKEGYEATILIDDKNNFKLEWGEDDEIPGEIKLYWLQDFEAWKVGLEHIDGTPIALLPGLTPAQVDNLKSAKIRTVEELAQATSVQIERIGMGAQKMKSLAENFLGASGGKIAMKMTTMEQENVALREQIEEMRMDMEAMKAKAAIEAKAEKEKK